MKVLRVDEWQQVLHLQEPAHKASPAAGTFQLVQCREPALLRRSCPGGKATWSGTDTHYPQVVLA